MNTLKSIQNQINTFKKQTDSTLADLKDQASKEFSLLMQSKQSEIQAMVSLVENSTELTTVVNDDYFHTWAIFDFDKLIDTKNVLQCELLSEYLQEMYYLHTDFKDSALTMRVGPCILINNSGDVLDQETGKWFLNKSNYETKEELYALIEAYMEKTGYFHSVVKCDYYGNPSFANTSKK